MKEERKINFKRYTSPPVSKMYLFKIVFYVILLVVMGYFLFKGNKKKTQVKVKDITEINHVIIGQ